MLDKVRTGPETGIASVPLPAAERPVEASATLDCVAMELRTALRRLAKAVVVITCRHDEVRCAMAATAVSELSMEPPSILVCVNKGASIFEPLSRTVGFCVNILHYSHRDIARNCSGALKGEARFTSGAWADTDAGIPFLGNAQEAIFCRREQRVDYGTHGIFIGRVVAAHVCGDVAPLIYVDGQYRT